MEEEGGGRLAKSSQGGGTGVTKSSLFFDLSVCLESASVPLQIFNEITRQGKHQLSSYKPLPGVP